MVGHCYDTTNIVADNGGLFCSVHRKLQELRDSRQRHNSNPKLFHPSPDADVIYRKQHRRLPVRQSSSFYLLVVGWQTKHIERSRSRVADVTSSACYSDLTADEDCVTHAVSRACNDSAGNWFRRVIEAYNENIKYERDCSSGGDDDAGGPTPWYFWLFLALAAVFMLFCCIGLPILAYVQKIQKAHKNMTTIANYVNRMSKWIFNSYVCCLFHEKMTSHLCPNLRIFHVNQCAHDITGLV